MIPMVQIVLICVLLLLVIVLGIAGLSLKSGGFLLLSVLMLFLMLLVSVYLIYGINSLSDIQFYLSVLRA